MSSPQTYTPRRLFGAWLFLLPALTVYTVFVLVPVAMSFRNSLWHWESPLLPPAFCGLQNFQMLMSDRVFWLALGHNLLLLAGSLLLQLPVAALLAILLHYPTRCRSLFRTAFFAPMIMPTAAVAVLWSYIYEPRHGIFSALLQVFSPDFQYAWLATPGVSMFWIFVVICWQYIGFHCVLFMAGLSTIPEDYYEAARLDGASEWQICRHIVLPCLKPTFIVSGTLSIIGSLKYFDLIYLLGSGLPETSREVMATYIYRLAFEESQGRYGYGSAAAVTLFLLALALVIPLQRRQIS